MLKQGFVFAPNPLQNRIILYPFPIATQQFCTIVDDGTFGIENNDIFDIIEFGYTLQKLKYPKHIVFVKWICQILTQYHTQHMYSFIGFCVQCTTHSRCTGSVDSREYRTRLKKKDKRQHDHNNNDHHAKGNRITMQEFFYHPIA
ncbi:MAG: hypothetical protein AB2687_05530 [Candidatus Thiodiazotropha taylori]